LKTAADIFHLLEQRRLGGHLTLSSLPEPRDQPDSLLLVISGSILFSKREIERKKETVPEMWRQRLVFVFA
jgi:hypothetical protein